MNVFWWKMAQNTLIAHERCGMDELRRALSSICASVALGLYHTIFDEGNGIQDEQVGDCAQINTVFSVETED